jgi:hypothetical protein
MSIITFALADTCTIYRKETPTITTSGDVSGIEQALYLDIPVHVAVSTRYWRVKEVGGIQSASSHVAFFEPEQDILIDDVIVSALWGDFRFRVVFVDVCCGFGRVWFKQVYLEQASSNVQDDEEEVNG